MFQSLQKRKSKESKVLSNKRAAVRYRPKVLLLLILELNKDSDEDQEDLKEYFGHDFKFLCLLIKIMMY